MIYYFSVHPSIVQQAPPPYYPSNGMENKALEHSLDLALDDPAKNPVYAGQNGYGYHGNPQNNGQHPNGGECKLCLLSYQYYIHYYHSFIIVIIIICIYILVIVKYLKITV